MMCHWPLASLASPLRGGPREDGRKPRNGRTPNWPWTRRSRAALHQSFTKSIGWLQSERICTHPAMHATSTYPLAQLTSMNYRIRIILWSRYLIELIRVQTLHHLRRALDWRVRTHIVPKLIGRHGIGASASVRLLRFSPKSHAEKTILCASAMVANMFQWKETFSTRQITRNDTMGSPTRESGPISSSILFDIGPINWISSSSGCCLLLSSLRTCFDLFR